MVAAAPCDASAGSGARGDQAFPSQLLIGIEDGVPGDAQQTGQGPLRGKAGARLEGPFEDGAAQETVELAVARLTRGGVDGKWRQ